MLETEERPDPVTASTTPDNYSYFPARLSPNLLNF